MPSINPPLPIHSSLTESVDPSIAEVQRAYGDKLCRMVGPEVLAKLPKLTCEELGIRGVRTDEWSPITPEQLVDKNGIYHSAVRFHDRGYPGLAIRCQDESGVQWVELIHCYGHHDYRVSRYAAGTDGKRHPSSLDRLDGNVYEEGFRYIRDLLHNKKVDFGFAFLHPPLFWKADPHPLPPAQQTQAELTQTGNSPLKQIAHKQDQLMEMERRYGRVFCHAVGTKKLARLPEMTSKELGLHGVNDYFEAGIAVEKLKGHPAVRFFDPESNRPGIAVHVRRVDSKTRKIVELVEVIFKRYPGSIGNYVSALRNQGSDGKWYASDVYLSPPINFGQIRDLLKGSIVPSHTTKGVTIQMAQPRREHAKKPRMSETYSLAGSFPPSVYKTLKRR